MSTMSILRPHAASLLALGLLTSACEEPGTDVGETQVRITAFGEAYVEDQIPAEDVVDGWTIELSRFLVAISDVEVDGEPLDRSYIVDLRSPSMGEGHPLGDLMVPADGDALVQYRIAPVESAEPVAATPDDALLMISNGLSLRVEGQARRGEETIDFIWDFTTDTRYQDCQSTAELLADEEATSQLTIHADHLFYDDLDSPEPNVAFDLVAAADGNADGFVTIEELGAVDITGQARYQVGSRDITDLAAFIEAQTMTLGHIDGEGHCESTP